MIIVLMMIMIIIIIITITIIIIIILTIVIITIKVVKKKRSYEGYCFITIVGDRHQQQVPRNEQRRSSQYLLPDNCCHWGSSPSF